jgi:hypothetical protein
MFCRLLFVLFSIVHCAHFLQVTYRLREDLEPKIDKQCKRFTGRDDAIFFQNHRFLKNNIFGEFVITIYRNIQPTFHYFLLIERKVPSKAMQILLRKRPKQNSKKKKTNIYDAN